MSDWVTEDGWELTEEESYSPSHSFHFDDDNYEGSKDQRLGAITE